MFFCFCELMARCRVLRLRLWFCKIEPVVALPDPDKKKTTQITRAIVNLLGSYLKSWLLKCHAYPLWLFDYLQSRWRENSQHRRQLQPVENARIVSDNACFGFHRGSVWQISQVVSMKLLHVMRRNLIHIHPIRTNLCKSSKNQNMGSLQKPGFSRKN